MTPLYAKIVKEMCLPLKKRQMLQVSAAPRLDDVHCFEVTDVCECAEDLTWKFLTDADTRKQTTERLAFLPAPKTWIEFRHGGARTAWLFDQADGRTEATWYAFTDVDGIVGTKFAPLPLAGNSKLGSELYIMNRTIERLGHDTAAAHSEAMYALAYAFLAMINSPRVIGRRMHAPHLGLEKRLLRAHQIVGKFPLRAWTEIKLEVTPPEDHFSEKPVEGHLTGRRALHFVRAHLRIVNGMLVPIKAHWRGDAALGIKQSRYKLTPPGDGDVSWIGG